MNDSILNTIKKCLGIESEYTHFDADIIMHINTYLVVLNQLGVGPENGFTISDDKAKWSEFIDDVLFEPVKSYIYLKVKLVFDPPQSSYIVSSIDQSLKELEWRINTIAENKNKVGGVQNE